MTIQELATLTGISARAIRYLISQGLCPPPTGGRKFASYGHDHVLAIRQYRYLRSMDFPHIAIKSLRAARAGYPFPISQGITLVVSLDVLGSGGEVEPLVEKAREALRRALTPDPQPDGESE